MKNGLFIAVTVDQYETPIACAETYAGLGKMVGMDGSNIYRMAKNGSVSTKTFNGEYFKVIKVEVEE